MRAGQWGAAALAILLFCPARADEFILDYCAEKPKGWGVYIPGQWLEPLQTPAGPLRGMPESGGGTMFRLEAALGDRSPGPVPMAVLLSSNRLEAWFAADTNRNGDLSDEAAQKRTVREGWILFEPVDLTISVKGKERPYRAALSVYPGTDPPRFRLSSRCHYRGRITLDGESYGAVLLDADTDGFFNGAEWYTDSLYVARDPGRTSVLWESSVRMVIVKGKWHFLEPAADGTLIRYLGTAEKLVPLEVNFKKSSVEIWSPRTGCVDLDLDDGVLRLPPGEYAWLDYDLSLRDESGADWWFTSGEIGKRPFRVTNESRRLDLCYPFSVKIMAVPRGETVAFCFSFIGNAGECVYVERNDAVLCPTFSVIDEEGNELLEAAFEAG